MPAAASRLPRVGQRSRVTAQFREAGASARHFLTVCLVGYPPGNAVGLHTANCRNEPALTHTLFDKERLPANRTIKMSQA